MSTNWSGESRDGLNIMSIAEDDRGIDTDPDEEWECACGSRSWGLQWMLYLVVFCRECGSAYTIAPSLTFEEAR